MLASLIASFASGETVLAVRRARRAAVAYLLAGLAALCGVGFLVGAGYIWASARYGALEAALGFGAGFVFIALVIVLVHKLTSRSRVRQDVQRRKAEMTTLGVATALAVLPTLLRGKAGVGAVVAPLAALAAYAIYRENSKSGPDKPVE